MRRPVGSPRAPGSAAGEPRGQGPLPAPPRHVTKPSWGGEGRGAAGLALNTNPCVSFPAPHTSQVPFFPSFFFFFFSLFCTPQLINYLIRFIPVQSSLK